MEDRPTFTVFTPTYNRATTLPTVYDSLQRQTFRDFVWLLVDDGSTDGTRELVQSWVAAAEFPIRYVEQAHGGLHVAINRGAQEARGRFFLNLDSDDSCLPNSLERFKVLWDSIPVEHADRFVGVTVLCQNPDGTVVGTRFPRDIIDSDTLEMRYRNRSKGDNWGFKRLEVMRQFPLPEPPGETFIPVGLSWAAMARAGYKTRYANEQLYNYFTDHSDTMTRYQPRIHAFGRRIFHQESLNEDLRWLRYAPHEVMRSAIQYSRYSFHLKCGVRAQVAGLKGWLPRLLWAVGLLFGYVMYRRDQRRNHHDVID